MQSNIRRYKDLSKNQAAVFDRVFSPISSTMLLEKQLVILSQEPAVRPDIATHFAKQYIATIKPVLLRRKALPKLNIVDVLRERRKGQDKLASLQSVFQDLSLRTDEATDAFWHYLERYLNGMLLAVPSLTVIEKALTYYIKAAISIRILRNWTHDRTVSLQKSFNFSLEQIYLHNTYARELQSALPGLRLDFSQPLPLQERLMWLANTYSLGLSARETSSQVLRKIGLLMGSITGCVTTLFALWYFKLLNAGTAILGLAALTCLSLLLRSLADSIQYDETALIEQNVNALEAMYRLVPIKIIDRHRIVKTHILGLQLEEGCARIDISGLSFDEEAASSIIEKFSDTTTFSAVGEEHESAAREPRLPDIAARADTSLEPLLSAESLATSGGNLPLIPKPKRKAADPPVAEISHKPAIVFANGKTFDPESPTNEVVLVSERSQFYAYLDVDKLEREGVDPLVIKRFADVLKPEKMLSAKDKGHSGVKLLKNPAFLRDGTCLNAKLKVVASRIDSGARIFSHQLSSIDRGPVLNVFDTYVSGKAAHR